MSSSSFLSAATQRAQDCLMTRWLCCPPEDGANIRIVDTGAAGRSLVAARDLPAYTRVFRERPLFVGVVSSAQPLACGEAEAVAAALLQKAATQPAAPEVAAVRSCLRAPKTALEGLDEAVRAFTTAAADAGAPWTADDIAWALGVASINVHAAPDGRGVLGACSSMMQHDCNPSARVTVDLDSSAEGGRSGFVSLHTLRDVSAGEPLTISYVVHYQSTQQRRAQLVAQHGFTCCCARCDHEPELCRAWRCPNCDDGPCSPANSSAACREVHCDACGADMRLDDDAWAPYVRAEESAVLDGAVLATLHPYHHRMVTVYRHNLVKVSPAQRAQIFMQFVEARTRLVGGRPHPANATDLEAAAAALRAAGDLEGSAAQLVEALRIFQTCLGADSTDAVRVASKLDGLKRRHAAAAAAAS